MQPEFKPIAELLLQARVDGKLRNGADFHTIMVESGIQSFNFEDAVDFTQELVPCEIIPEAIKVAQKYDLKLKI